MLAPPSPTATSLPKTPPESPAIFHYTLPSPGLVSPLALFESLSDNSTIQPACQPWVEQVDFRRPLHKSTTNKCPFRDPTSAKGSSLPSLDQISARLSSHAHVRAPVERATRLPAFLAQSRTCTEPVEVPADRPRLTVCIGRLQMPLRNAEPVNLQHLTILPPKSPCSPSLPQLQVTTLRVPPSWTLSPTELSESNLLALDSRERKAQDMLFALRRRVLPSLPSDRGLNGYDGERVTDDRRIRRQSAPAEMLTLPRGGFEHPVLSLPGGF